MHIFLLRNILDTFLLLKFMKFKFPCLPNNALRKSENRTLTLILYIVWF